MEEFLDEETKQTNALRIFEPKNVRKMYGLHKKGGCRRIRIKR
jgi:hypothetical protein